MASKTNSRKTPRVALTAPARADGPRGPVRGTCRSLSRGGMFFSGPTLPVGQSIQLHLELPQLGKVEALGEVRYHVNTDGGGMGIRFTRLAAEHLERVNQFVAANA